MKLWCSVVFSLLFSSAYAGPGVQPNIHDDTKFSFIQGQILVQPKAGLSEKAFDRILRANNSRRMGKLSQTNVHIISVPPRAEQAVVRALSNNPNIGFAELDLMLQPTLILNDPNIKDAYQISRIGAPAAWNAVSGKDRLLAVCDTGADSTHPDLVNNLMPNLGWNTASNNNNWEDINGHGTAVSGVMAAVGNNSRGAAGIAYQAKIIPVRVSDRSDGSASISALASCVNYAADRGAKGANLSYSGVCGSETIFSSAAYLRNKTGGVVVASSGNTGKRINYRNSDTITCVGATDANDNIASFSSFGNYVDLSAPGVSTFTTRVGGSYYYVSGTSFSSPITLGVYGLVMEANPNLTSSMLDEVLFNTALDLGPTGWDPKFGHGRVDAAAAVQAARGTNTVDTTPPEISFIRPTDGSFVSGMVAVEIAATDNVGVKSVSLKVNGQIFTDDTAPYQFAIDTDDLPEGNLVLEATAVDEKGNAASTSITVRVANDQIAPNVSITHPQNGAVVSGTITVSVSASDDKQLSRVSLAIDGRVVNSILTSNSSTTLDHNWTPCPNRGQCRGNSTLTATAEDAAGNTSTTSITVSKSR